MYWKICESEDQHEFQLRILILMFFGQMLQKRVISHHCLKISFAVPETPKLWTRNFNVDAELLPIIFILYSKSKSRCPKDLSSLDKVFRWRDTYQSKRIISIRITKIRWQSTNNTIHAGWEWVAINVTFQLTMDNIAQTARSRTMEISFNTNKRSNSSEFKSIQNYTMKTRRKKMKKR